MRYSEIFKEAKRLHSLGFAVHWLHARSKRPIESGWTSGPRKEWTYLAETYTADLNLGVRLGTPSRIGGGYLAVVDVDVKSTDPRHLEEALASVRNLLGQALCPVVRSGRGNGSRHYYCLTVRPFKTYNPAQSREIVKVHQPSKRPSKKELSELSEEEILAGTRLSHAWEISLYSDGRQVVLPPSVHPDSGELYRWSRKLPDVSALPVLTFGPAHAGTAVIEGPGGLAVGDSDGGGSVREAHLATERSEDATLQGFKIEPVDLGWLAISDEVRDAIVGGKGVKDRSGYLLRASDALLSAGLSQNEVLTVLTDPKTFLGACGYEHAQTKDRAKAAAWVFRYTVKRKLKEHDATSVFGNAAEIPEARKLTAEEMEDQAEEFAEARSWKQDLDRQGAKVKTTLKNLDLIFTNGVDGTVFIEDLFASRIEYGCDTPWGGKSKEYIKDIDMTLVKRWLGGGEFNIEPSTAAIIEATALVAHRQRVHPVREWLNSLKWDGTPRIDTWIKDYCQGRAEEPYLSEASRKFLLAMVKRVFEPGCQWDYVLVLEGKQGRLKSTIARTLAGDKWFMDNLPDLKDKDSMLNLHGKWLIELGELANVKRADFNQVKAYLVRRTDTVRPHYGRLVADVPRQSVFVGTVNEGQYLKDPTGNRRYWPVKVGVCDAGGLAAVREQLFAEAMHVYRTTNEILMMGPAATAQATEAQEQRKVEDDESDMRERLTDFIESDKSNNFRFDGFRIRDLMEGFDRPWASWNGKGYMMNVGASILENLGFEKGRSGSRRLWRMTEDTLCKKTVIPPDEGGARDGAGGAVESEEYDFR